MRIDGEDSQRWRGCGISPPPCLDDGLLTVLTFRPSEMTDGVHEVQIVAVGNDSSLTDQRFPLLVDKTAPAPLAGLSVVGADRWRSENRFDVSWANPKADGLSPVSGVHYLACPVSDTPQRVDRCMTGTRAGYLDRIPDLAMPSSGVWRVRVALRDSAGNIDLETGAAVGELRLDMDAPSAAFGGVDPLDPARLRVSASDDHSGIAAIELEARQLGDGSWRSVAFNRETSELSAVLDDDTLPQGTYEVRARVIDRVGHERTTVRPETVSLPVRDATVMVAGRPKEVRTSKKAKPRRVLDPSPVAKFGEALRIEGVVSTAFGGGRGGASIEVSERVDAPGSAWKRLSAIVSAADGRFSFRAPAGPARTLRFSYPGSTTARAASTEVTVRVAAGVTLATSARRLNNGDSVVLSGRLLGMPIPEQGKLVTLQAMTGRGWRTFATARARSATGRWSYRYRFTATQTTSTYSFRVVVPQDAGYPFMRGVSKVRKVLVRGSG